jgi:hypothetical protein
MYEGRRNIIKSMEEPGMSPKYLLPTIKIAELPKSLN